MKQEDKIEQEMCKERINSLLRSRGVSIASFEDTETERVRMRNQLNGTAALTFDILRKVAYAFHDVSCDWLILGEGNVLKAEHSGSSIYTTHYHNEVAPNSYQYGPINMGKDTTQIIKNNEIERLNQQIMLLQKENEELRRDKEFQRTIIESLTAAHKK